MQWKKKDTFGLTPNMMMWHESSSCMSSEVSGRDKQISHGLGLNWAQIKFKLSQKNTSNAPNMLKLQVSFQSCIKTIKCKFYILKSPVRNKTEVFQKLRVNNLHFALKCFHSKKWTVQFKPWPLLSLSGQFILNFQLTNYNSLKIFNPAH